MRGEVWDVGLDTFERERAAASDELIEKAVDQARFEFGSSWPEVQAAVWAWVWRNRKMVVVSFAFWKWRLSQIRGKVFEKAFGPCPFNWKKGP